MQLQPAFDGLNRRERPLTAKEQERLGAAIAEANRFRAKILARRNGKPFPPAWEAIAQMRDEPGQGRPAKTTARD
jgi:hypothetical protein